MLAQLAGSTTPVAPVGRKFATVKFSWRFGELGKFELSHDAIGR